MVSILLLESIFELHDKYSGLGQSFQDQVFEDIFEHIITSILYHSVASILVGIILGIIIALILNHVR